MKARRVKRALLDQGHLQILLSQFECSLDERELQRIMAILPKSDHYVFFDVSEAKRLKQLEQRGYQSRPGMDEELRQAWQAAAVRHYAWLLEQLPALAPAEVELVTKLSSNNEPVVSIII